MFETTEWLKSYAWFRERYRHGPRLDLFGRLRPATWMAVEGLGLFAMAWWPNPLFALTWVAPLLALIGILEAAGIETPLRALRYGDYSLLVQLGVAALICGFFWEMWNYYSLPKWHYSIPYVMKAELFEMPLTGYGGHLPFGPACLCIWLLICPNSSLTGQPARFNK